MDNTVLKASGIYKTFDNGEVKVEVLKGVDVDIREGEFVAVVGESGSGKSTLLYVLAGIEKPTAGTVEMMGKNICTMDDESLSRMRRQDFSFVYQYDNLVPNLTAYENIILPLLLDRKKESEFKPEVVKIMEYLAIAGRKDNLPKELSGGEQQRVALARALVTSPKLIFLDEPTGSLDKERGRQVMDLLQDINKTRGVALVMVTHSASHASCASRIIEIEDGRIKA